MYMLICNREVIGQIISTFAKRPKTYVDRITISDGGDGYQIARVLYYNGIQHRHGTHRCVVEVTVNKATYLHFWCCKTGKKAEIKL